MREKNLLTLSQVNQALKKSKSTKILPQIWKAHGIPVPAGSLGKEHVFHPVRKWRFDFAWPEKKLAVEIEGGVFSGGGHVRGAMYRKNCEKYNAAAELGWTLLRYLPKEVDFLQIKRIYDSLKFNLNRKE